VLVVTTQGLDGIEKKFERAAEGIWRRGLMVVVGQLVKAQTQRRIEAEKTDPGGAPWAAWAPSTAARRNGGQSLLVYNRRLLASIFSKPTEFTAQIGTPVPYGGFLQDGTSHMVARQFLGLSSDNEDEVSKAVTAFVVSRFF
jgi:phage virion morphogenesis protein